MTKEKKKEDNKQKKMDSTLSDVWREVVFTSDDTNTLWNSFVWDARTGNLLHNFKFGNSRRGCLSLIGDDYLISGLNDRNFLCIWRLVRGLDAPIKIPCVGKITALGVSPNGKYCVGAIGSKLYLWQTLTGTLFCVLDKHYRSVTCIKFTNDGKYFVSGGRDSNVMAWDFFELIDLALRMPREEHILKPVWSDCLHGEVMDIHVGHFGLQARVVVLGSDLACKLYDMFTGTCMFTIVPDDICPCSLTMDPAECFIFLGAESGDILRFKLYEWAGEKTVTVSTRNCEDVYASHSAAVTCMAVSNDGQLLGSGSADGTAKIWSIYHKLVLHVLKHSGSVTNIFFELHLPSLNYSNTKVLPKIFVKPFKFVVSAYNKGNVELRLQGHCQTVLTTPADKRLQKFLRQRKDAVVLKGKSDCQEKVHMLTEENTELFSECQMSVVKSLPDVLYS